MTPEQSLQSFSLWKPLDTLVWSQRLLLANGLENGGAASFLLRLLVSWCKTAETSMHCREHWAVARGAFQRAIRAATKIQLLSEASSAVISTPPKPFRAAFENQSLANQGTLKNVSLKHQYLSPFLGKLGTRTSAFLEHRLNFLNYNTTVCIGRGGGGCTNKRN